MKKLIEKDKITRKRIQESEKEKIILKSINYNNNFFNLIRWKAINSLNKNFISKSSITFISNRCVYTKNKKKFSYITNFSRIIFLRLVKTRSISNIYKSSW